MARSYVCWELEVPGGATFTEENNKFFITLDAVMTLRGARDVFPEHADFWLDLPEDDGVMRYRARWWRGTYTDRRPPRPQ